MLIRLSFPPSVFPTNQQDGERRHSCLSPRVPSGVVGLWGATLMIPLRRHENFYIDQSRPPTSEWTWSTYTQWPSAVLSSTKSRNYQAFNPSPWMSTKISHLTLVLNEHPSLPGAPGNVKEGLSTPQNDANLSHHEEIHLIKRPSCPMRIPQSPPFPILHHNSPFVFFKAIFEADLRAETSSEITLQDSHKFCHRGGESPAHKMKSSPSRKANCPVLGGRKTTRTRTRIRAKRTMTRTI